MSKPFIWLLILVFGVATIASLFDRSQRIAKTVYFLGCVIINIGVLLLMGGKK